MKSAKCTCVTSWSESDRNKIYEVVLSYFAGITVDSLWYQVFITQTFYLEEDKGWILLMSRKGMPLNLNPC